MKRTFEDFFNPLEEEERENLLKSQHNEKLRSLSTSFFARKYLLSVPGGSVRSQRQAVFVKPLVSNSQKILVGLLWNALFGKKFRVIHWNLLFDVLIRTLDKNSSSRALMLVLRLTATSKDVRDLNSCIDPVRRIVSRKLDEEHKEVFLKNLEAHLGLRLPEKAPKIEELLEIEVGNYNPRKPKIPQRKRGYDDKGNLPDKSNPIVPSDDSESLEAMEDIFELLLRQTDRYFNFFYH
jgi:hypothetical protein